MVERLDEDGAVEATMVAAVPVGTEISDAGVVTFAGDIVIEIGQSFTYGEQPSYGTAAELDAADVLDVSRAPDDCPADTPIALVFPLEDDDS